MPETADRIESLFAVAVALQPEERGAYLERECSGDDALRDRVVALLRAHDRAGHVIDRPVNGDPVHTAGYAPMSEQPGTIIAERYKLLEEIGQGGMGTVWAAEQTAPVRRKVALKLIKAGMDSRSVLARFEAERQALALMDHPNIAKVLDGGLTESGRPFFVMEYVKGVPITEYCDATRLSVEERLNLFVQVCSALQHAHQKGIIHRDLKPLNILVAPYDDKSVPKVIDFGLAKAMHQSLTEKTLYTAHEMVLGTPLYMSPEQAQLNNLDVDTRADIYSLGVLLYELLTGTTPLERQRFKEAAWDEIRRMIREDEPPTPSTRLSSTETLPTLATFRHTEPAKLKKLVRGELDWIVMKALEKDRTRRYETASGLARDIQRYLKDEVVEARPPSTGYRIGKFVRRHRAQVMAGGLVLLALFAGIAGTTWGLIREAHANARLEASLRRERKANADLSSANAKVKARYDLAVDAVKTFHTGVSEDFLLKEEKFKALRNRLLKSASDFYGKLGALLGEETDFGSRRALARSNFELARLTEQVGRKEDALTAHRSVLAAREAMAAEPEADLETRVEVGRSLTEVTSLLDLMGRADEALAVYRRLESLAGSAGSDPTARAELAGCCTRLARVLQHAGQPAEALAACLRARTDLETLAAAPGASNEVRRDLAETVHQLACHLWYTGKPAEAVNEFRAALQIDRKLADENPAVPEFRFNQARSHDFLGKILSDTGKPEEAEAELRRALALYQELVNGNPAITVFRRNLAVCRQCIGSLLSETGKPVEAKAELHMALALEQKLVDEDPGDIYFRGGLAECHTKLGRLRLQMGKPEEAEAECQTAVTIWQKLVEDTPGVALYHCMLAQSVQNLGDVVLAAGRFAEARRYFERAIALEEPQVREDPTITVHRHDLACLMRRRGLTQVHLGDPAGGSADIRRALTSLERLPLLSAGDRFQKACCHATLAGLAGRAGSGVSVAEGEQQVARAMGCLSGAVSNGFRNTDLIRIESCLDPLRQRAQTSRS